MGDIKMPEISEKLKEALAKEGIELTAEETAQLSDLTSQGILDDNKLSHVMGGALSPKMQKALQVAVLVSAVALGGAAIRHRLNQGKEKKNKTAQITASPVQASSEKYREELQIPPIALLPVELEAPANQ